jgi:hypothetical protein
MFTQSQFEELQSKGILTKWKDFLDYQSHLLSEEERAEIKTAQVKEEKQREYQNFKSSLDEKSLADYNIMFGE